MYHIEIKAFCTALSSKSKTLKISNFESNEAITKQIENAVIAFFEEDVLAVRVSESNQRKVLNVKRKDLSPPSALPIRITDFLGLTISNLESASYEVMKVREQLVLADNGLSEVFTPIFNELLSEQKHEEAAILARQLPESATKTKALARLLILE